MTYKETPLCITLEATEVPDEYDAILFGSVRMNIPDVSVRFITRGRPEPITVVD